MFGIGMTELLVILAIVLVIFGNEIKDSLPLGSTA